MCGGFESGLLLDLNTDFSPTSQSSFCLLAVRGWACVNRHPQAQSFCKAAHPPATLLLPLAVPGRACVDRRVAEQVLSARRQQQGTSLIFKKCISRESVPGYIDGNDVFYKAADG